MDIVIKRPQISEIEEISSLFIETIQDNFKYEGIEITFASGMQREIENQINLLKLDLDSNGKDDCFYIAHFQDKIVGTIALGKASSIIQDNYQTVNKNIPEIKSVYVLPQYQGQGIGAQLFQHILRLLQHKGIKEFYLDSGYKRAQEYWRKKLGDPVKILSDFWAKDAHHMIWHCQVEVL